MLNLLDARKQGLLLSDVRSKSHIVSMIVVVCAGIPVEKVSADETERLINMESVLHGRVIGQEEAVVAISRAIRRARVGLKNPNRPIASFIFSGPTGPPLLPAGSCLVNA